MYAKIENGVITKWPYTASDLFADNPNVYFPDFSTQTLARFNVAVVVATAVPPYDVINQTAVEGIPTFSAERSRWEQTWQIVSLSDEQKAQNLAALQAAIVGETQDRLDTFARTRNYDGILSACTYATSTIPKFKAEGQYCVDARDATWAKLYSLLEEVQAGTRPMPAGFADIEAELPVLTWPS